MHYSNDIFLKLKYTTQVFLANMLLLHTLLFSQTLNPYKKGSSSSCTIVWCHTRKNPGEKNNLVSSHLYKMDDAWQQHYDLEFWSCKLL